MSTSQIWDQFSDRIFNFILSRTNDEEVAKDILQEVFIKIHTNLDSLNDKDSLASWLFTITRNTIFDYYRHKKVQQKKQLILSDNAGLFEEEITQFCEACLHLFIEELPEKYKEAILSTELGDFSQKDYAQQIGISYSGLKSRVQRGRALLNDYFKKCCLSTNSKGESTCLHKDNYACTC